MMITGKSIIGNELAGSTDSYIQAYDPSSGNILEEKIFAASDEEIEKAISKARTAFATLKYMPDVQKAEFLESIGNEIMELGDVLVERACRESGLPEARIRGERGRTVGQLNMFAELLREGSWVDARIDTAIPDRSPAPKPDLRTMLVPVGPVVVFTASNFPLAFSTAGGDTASALAAGNPVIVKAHESHPGTNELVSQAIIRAAEKTGMPDGTFSSLNGIGYSLGEKLVTHPEVKSVAFTGSFKGGKALYDLAQNREHPIPVFAEMGSINPVVILPGCLAESADSLGTKLAGSITLGAGQFCTNPGLIIGLEGEDMDDFVDVLSKSISESTSQTMLNKGIQQNYLSRVNDLSGRQELEIVSRGKNNNGDTEAVSIVARVNGNKFLENPNLHEEVFGPYSLLVSCSSKEELLKVVHNLEGQLTTTAWVNQDDIVEHKDILNAMREVAGRLIFNGVPTGVEVCHSMQHGGPYPATTDSRFTSVGTGAIKRFVRPLCFQDSPPEFLPEALKNENPLGIWRTVNGDLTKD